MHLDHGFRRAVLPRYPPSWKNVFWVQTPALNWKRLAECFPLVMVLPVSMVSEMSRLKRWWNSPQG
ncbi:hypothetical protein AB205_0164470 [Aquarana catesbeiana]|uniref:Uncharacterized protein n=1 Tax=Aquarana catesbeiana TaxID=8400 RepID=A0A2G9QGX1_AQUCT|nr:hypothetical protein AB205_0164470 [Aquarana catesbeiana]